MAHLDSPSLPERSPTRSALPERPAADPDPDRDIRALVAEGDSHEALRRLMHRYGRAVYGFCREVLHDAVLADDVLQQIYLDAYRDLGTFRGQSGVRAWLFGIARHRAFDASKARRRARARIGEGDPTELPDLGPAPSAVLEDLQVQEVLVTCVRELDPDVQVALLLRFQQGFTFDEMAVVCGEKAGTLHARVTRALPLLRARIQRRIGRPASLGIRRTG